ncbi:MAG: beta strand repeat-containing protein [Chthoniobacteraceae bacterium]
MRLRSFGSNCEEVDFHNPHIGMKTPCKIPSSRSLVSSIEAAEHTRSRLTKILLACSVAALSGQFQAQAATATFYWDTTTTGLWSNGANWSDTATSGGNTGTAPSSSSTAVFNQSSVNGDETVQLSADATIAGLIFNNTEKTQLESSSSTAHTLTLGSGAITVNSGAGAVTIGDATNTLNVSLANGAAITLNGATGLTFTNTVGFGAGSNIAVTVNGAGNTVTLGALTLNASNVASRAVSFGGSANVTVNGLVADGGSVAAGLTYNGSGTLTLSGNNTYTGVTTIGNTTAGSVATVSINNVGALGAGASALSMNGGTGGGGKLVYTGNSATWTRGITISNASTTAEVDSATAGQTLTISTGNITFSASSETLILGGVGNTTISSNIVGNGYITKKDSGTVLLTGSNGTGSSNAITISGGTLQFGGTNALMSGATSNWTAAKIKVSSGATVAFNVGGTGEFTTGNVTTLLTNLDGAVTNNGLQAGSTIGFDTTNAEGGNFTIANVIKDTTGTGGGSVGVTKLGSGMLTLNGANTYSGTTTVTSGTLNLGGSLAGGVNVQSNGVFIGNGTVSGLANVSGSVAGSVSFSGDVTVNNTGSMGGGHSFAGNVTLNNSTVGNVTSDISLALGKTLRGNGGTLGIVTVGSGVIAPGSDSSVGNLTVGGITCNASSYIDIRINSATEYDTLTTTTAGALTLAGDLNLTVSSSYVAGDDTLLLILNAGSSSVVTSQFGEVLVNGTSYSGAASTLISIGGEQFTLSYTAGDGNDIGLVAVAVPEPSTWAIAVCGCAALILLQRRRRFV